MILQEPRFPQISFTLNERQPQDLIFIIQISKRLDELRNTKHDR